MPRTDRRRTWILVALGAYVLAVAIVVLTPVSYEGIIHAIGDIARDELGIDWFGSGWIEFTANIAMFIPLGFLLTLFFRHHWYGVAIALAVSALVEIAQIVIPSRQPSLRDIIANVLGAAVGAALAWVLVVRRDKRRAPVRASE